MAVCFAVIEVLVGALHVHFAGVPVAISNGGLRAPVRPDAEFCVAKPVGYPVGLERFAGRQEGCALRGGPSRSQSRESKGRARARDELKRLAPVDVHGFAFLS